MCMYKCVNTYAHMQNNSGWELDVKRGFIQKVYTVLSIQLGIHIYVCLIFVGMSWTWSVCKQHSVLCICLSTTWLEIACML
jgi:FtsH-binding integral membrane protein